MLISILVNFVPIIIAIVLHEVAHGYAAYLLGDDTAKRYRRLSLNPVRHVDVFGTLILPTLLILSKTGLVFRLGKTGSGRLFQTRNPRRDHVDCRSSRHHNEYFSGRIVRPGTSLGRRSGQLHWQKYCQSVFNQHGGF